MRKLIAILAVLMLVAAVAISETSDFVGTWVNAEQETDGSFHLVSFTLCEDGHSYWLSYGFYPEGDAASIRLSWSGTWSITKSGSVFVPMNEKGGCTYHLGPDGNLYDDLTGRLVYQRAGGAQIPMKSSVSDWTTLSQGVYQIGRDIEPGRYLITSDGFTGLNIYSDSGHHIIAFVGDGYHSTYTVDLADGTIEISGDAITLNRQFPE